MAFPKDTDFTGASNQKISLRCLLALISACLFSTTSLGQIEPLSTQTRSTQTRSTQTRMKTENFFSIWITKTLVRNYAGNPMVPAIKQRAHLSWSQSPLLVSVTVYGDEQQVLTSLTFDSNFLKIHDNTQNTILVVDLADLTPLEKIQQLLVHSRDIPIDAFMPFVYQKFLEYYGIPAANSIFQGQESQIYQLEKGFMGNERLVTDRSGCILSLRRSSHQQRSTDFYQAKDCVLIDASPRVRSFIPTQLWREQRFGHLKKIEHFFVTEYAKR